MNSSNIDSFYESVRDELAIRGIFIAKKDIYILVKIVFKSIFKNLESDKVLNIDNSVIINKLKNYYKFKIGKKIETIPERLNLSDTKNREMFNKIFLPLIDDLK
jgi:hypothetical protein